jgi:hypothetical protein
MLRRPAAARTSPVSLSASPVCTLVSVKGFSVLLVDSTPEGCRYGENYSLDSPIITVLLKWETCQRERNIERL